MSSQNLYYQRHLKLGMPFVRDRALLIHHSLSTLQVALIGLVIGVLLAAGFAILMDSFQWVNDLVYPFYGCYSNHSDDCLGPYPGSLVWLWYASKTGFDHYYGGISHRS